MKLKQLISEDIINEGHSGEDGPIIDNNTGEKPKSKEEAMKFINDWIESSKDNDYGDLKHFMSAKFVGNVSEDRLDKYATKYENDYVAVGIVDGEYWSSYWFRT